MPRPVYGPILSRARAYRLFTLAEARAELAAQSPRIVAAHDPLRAVPRGTFTLDDFSYEASKLSHHHFRNCKFISSGRA